MKLAVLKRHRYIMHVAYLRLYRYGVTRFALTLMKQLFLIMCKQFKCAVHNRVLLLFDTCLCAPCASQFLTYPASKNTCPRQQWECKPQYHWRLEYVIRHAQLILPNISQQVPEHTPASVSPKYLNFASIF